MCPAARIHVVLDCAHACAHVQGKMCHAARIHVRDCERACARFCTCTCPTARRVPVPDWAHRCPRRRLDMCSVVHIHVRDYGHICVRLCTYVCPISHICFIDFAHTYAPSRTCVIHVHDCAHIPHVPDHACARLHAYIFPTARIHVPG